jgi:hypothetical protein
MHIQCRAVIAPACNNKQATHVQLNIVFQEQLHQVELQGRPCEGKQALQVVVGYVQRKNCKVLGSTHTNNQVQWSGVVKIAPR